LERETVMQQRSRLIVSIFVLSLALTATVPVLAHGPGGGNQPWGWHQGWHMAPGQMMGPCQGHMLGYGMMGRGQMMAPGTMGQGQMMGPGQGMMGRGQMMGPGQGMMGYGMMGQGQMMGPGQGMMGQGMGRPMMQPLAQDLSAADVQHMMEHRLAWQGNPNLKVGTVQEKDDDTIVAEIVTQDGSLVQRLKVDRHTGWMQPEQ